MMFASINPATGAELTTYDFHSPDEVDSRLAILESGFKVWRHVPYVKRSRLLRRISEGLGSRKEELARLMTLEMGKPFLQAIAEIEKCATACRFYAEHGQTMLTDKRVVSDATESGIVFEPLGIVLAIMPWNFPFWQVIRCAVPALLAGNTVAVKHAPNAGGCALALETIFNDAGGASYYFNLFVDIPQVENVIADRRVKAISLTGSVAAGRSVAAVCGRHVKPCLLELGGSDPFIVLPDADLDLAVETGIKSRFLNNGQSCIAAKRFILHEAIEEKFLELFVSEVVELVTGNPLETNVDIGPLARADLRDTLERQVTESVNLGARIMCGGKSIPGPGNYFEPTVLTHVRTGQPAFDEEVFGPVAACCTARDEEEALVLANSTQFGLGATVFTQNPESIARFSRELEAGSVFVNGMVKSDPRLPFGGIKDSGIGRELGYSGIRAFTNVKTVWVR